MKKLTELTDNDAIEIYDLVGGPSISNEAKIFQVKGLLTTNKFYNTSTNIPGMVWWNVFKLLTSKGYEIE